MILLLVASVLLSDLPVDSLPEQEHWKLVVPLKYDATDKKSEGGIPLRDIVENVTCGLHVSL